MTHLPTCTLRTSKCFQRQKHTTRQCKSKGYVDPGVANICGNGDGRGQMGKTRKPPRRRIAAPTPTQRALPSGLINLPPSLPPGQRAFPRLFQRLQLLLPHRFRRRWEIRGYALPDHIHVQIKMHEKFMNDVPSN